MIRTLCAGPIAAFALLLAGCSSPCEGELAELIAATEADDSTRVVASMDAGASPTTKCYGPIAHWGEDSYLSAAWLATAMGYNEALAAMLTEGLSPDYVFHGDGEAISLLGAAAMGGNTGGLELLLDAGADPNATALNAAGESSSPLELVMRGPLGGTQLWKSAASWDPVRMAQLLVDAGADPSIKHSDPSESLAFQVVASMGRPSMPMAPAMNRDDGLQVLKILKDNGEPTTPSVEFDRMIEALLGPESLDQIREILQGAR